MNDIMGFFNSISDASFLQTISRIGVRDLADQFRSYRIQLVEILSSLKIHPQGCFELDAKQEEEFFVKDLRELEQRIAVYDDVDGIRHEIEQELGKLKGAKELAPDVITKEELDDEMKDLESMHVDLHNDIVVQERMRTNSYLQVFAGYQKSTGLVVAVRRILVAHMMKRSFGIFKRYIEDLYKVRHPAFLKIVGASWGVNCFSIVAEYIPRGNLAERLRSKNMPLDANKLTMCALGIASGMAYLHAQGISHKCLKTRHILLDADDLPCIYGLFTAIWRDGWLMRMFSSVKSQILYFAPEVLSGHEPTPKSDVYSYGIILWEMATREVPFQGMSETEIAYQVVNNHLMPPIPESCPQNLKTLIESCINPDPEQRPTFSEILAQWESGEVAFPGTSTDTITGYYEQDSSESDPAEDLSSLSLSQITQKIAEDLTLVGGLGPVFASSQDTTSLVPYVLDSVKQCTSSKFAGTLASLVKLMLEKDRLREVMRELDFGSAMLNLLMRFGRASMSDFLDCFAVLLNDRPIRMTADNLRKFASFMVAKTVETRIRGVEFLIEIFKRHQFVNDGDWVTIISDLMLNIFPASEHRLLSSSFNLLNLLISLDIPWKSLVQLDVVLRVIPLLFHDEADIRKLGYLSVKGLIREGCASRAFNEELNKQLESVVSISDSTQLLSFLSILAVALKSPSGPSVFASSIKLRKFLLACFESEPAVCIYALQICYVQLLNCSGFSIQAIIPPIKRLLSNPHEKVVVTAAACLIKLSEKIKLDDELLTVMGKMMDGNDELRMFGLRMMGSLAQHPHNYHELAKHCFIPKIAKLLSNPNQEVKRMAINVLSVMVEMEVLAIGAVSDYSPIVENISCVFEYLGVEKASAMLLYNLMVDPRAVDSYVEFVPRILDMISKQPSDCLTLLRILFRVVQCHQLPSDVTKNILSTVKSAEVCSPELVFEIVNVLSTFDGGVALILESSFDKIAAKYRLSLPLDHEIQPVLDELLARIKAEP